MIPIESTFLADDNSFDTPFLIPQKGVEPEPRLPRMRVLVVDDQKLIADTLSEILGNAGFEAMAAYDGKEALEAMSGFYPHWVISDVVMPLMNGVELAMAIRTHFPAAEVLLFSGQAGISEILEDAQREGYEFEIIAKPVHPKKLIERLTGHHRV